MLDNLFSELGDSEEEELVTLLASGQNVRIERIVSTGQVSPDGFWYDQTESEWVVLLKGMARIEFENGRVIELTAGDHLLIPARQKHRVAYTDLDNPTVWLAVFFQD